MLVGISVTSGLPPVRGGHDIQVVKFHSDTKAAAASSSLSRRQ